METIKAYPVNDSWYQFSLNRKNILCGTLRYIATNPISCWPVLKARLDFALLKKNLITPVITPEGFELTNNRELLIYTQIFIERNLAWSPMLREFKNHKQYPLPVYVIDVGAHVGFFSQFMGRHNQFGNYHLFEPATGLSTRAAQLNWSRKSLKKDHSRIFLTLNSIGLGRENESIREVNIGSIISPRDLGAEKTGTTEMIITNLNKYAEKLIPIFCLKIDTDGMNHEVLMGAKKILPRVMWVLVERDEEYCYCEEILTRFGFKFQGNSSPDDAVWFNGNARVNWTHEFRQQKGLPAFSQLELPNLNLESKHGGSC